MPVPTFDIFRGRYPEPDAIWVEPAEGLGAAVERMKVMAAEKPGPYFVFDVRAHQLMAAVDTTPKSKSQIA
jgi:hypothetical protein